MIGILPASAVASCATISVERRRRGAPLRPTGLVRMPHPLEAFARYVVFVAITASSVFNEQCGHAGKLSLRQIRRDLDGQRHRLPCRPARLPFRSERAQQPREFSVCQLAQVCGIGG